MSHVLFCPQLQRGPLSSVDKWTRPGVHGNGGQCSKEHHSFHLQMCSGNDSIPNLLHHIVKYRAMLRCRWFAWLQVSLTSCRVGKQSGVQNCKRPSQLQELSKQSLFKVSLNSGSHMCHQLLKLTLDARPHGLGQQLMLP